jgi:hypothetical protein
MAISTNGTVITRLAGGLYNTVISNATYLEVASQDPSQLANTLYSRDFAKLTDLAVATTLLANLGLAGQAGLDAWVAAQLTAAGAANKGAKIVSLLNDFAGLSADATWGTYATAFNTKVDAALAASQKTGSVEAKFEAAASAPTTALSFTLSTDVNVFTGGAGDDSFAAPATQLGVAATTVNSGDTITGGLGIDTLTITSTSTNNNTLAGLTVTGVENIVITGSDNLVGTSTVGALLATKVAADAALASAQSTYGYAVQIRDAYVAVKLKTEVQLADIASATTVPSGSNFTLAQYKAAAAASQASLTGITLVTDGVDTTSMQDRATVLHAAAVVAADTALTAIGTAQAAVTAANNAYYAAGGSASGTAASVSAATFTGATSLSIDGALTDVTSLADTTAVTLSGTSAANTLKYSAGAASPTINLSSYRGTITLDDNSTTSETSTLKTLTVNGSVYRASAASTTTNQTASAGTVTIVDNMGITTDESVATLKLGITSAAVVDVSDLDKKLVTLDASASTGALTITTAALNTGNVLASVVGGSGVDTLTLNFNTDINGLVGPLSASANAGAGNDVVTISSTGTGNVAVDGGAGNDTVSITSTLLSTKVTLAGGDGTDKLKFTTVGSSISTEEQLLIGSQVSGFERAEFVGVTSVDASKYAQFTTFDSGANTTSFTKVADAQAINTTTNSVAITASGYVAKGSDAATLAGYITTQYAGSLTVNASGASLTNTVKAANVTLNVNNTSSTTARKVGDQTASSITLTGDVQTATVKLTSGNDYVTGPTSNDVISSITITPSTTSLSAGQTALGALTTLTLSGVGSAIVDNSATTTVDSVTVSGSKLATIDASALGGVKGALAGTSAGNPLGGLTYTGNAYMVETVTLGSGQDTINVKSSYSLMDTINNFKLVGASDGSLITAKSDDISVTGVTNFVKQTTNLTGTTLGAVLAVAADSTLGNSLVFQYSGDTYVYVDAGTAGALDSGDTVIKLAGQIDLDLLVLALNS